MLATEVGVFLVVGLRRGVDLWEPHLGLDLEVRLGGRLLANGRSRGTTQQNCGHGMRLARALRSALREKVQPLPPLAVLLVRFRGGAARCRASAGRWGGLGLLVLAAR